MEKNELGFKMLKMSHTKQIALEMEAPLSPTPSDVAFLRLEPS